MAIKFRFSNHIRPTLIILVSALWLTACDQAQQSSTAGNEKDRKQLETINETATNAHELFTLEELEKQLQPLKEQIKSLESELEDRRKASESSQEKKENQQWELTKLKETISTLKEVNHDLRSQVKAQLAEIDSLQDALNRSNQNSDTDN